MTSWRQRYRSCARQWIVACISECRRHHALIIPAKVSFLSHPCSYCVYLSLSDAAQIVMFSAAARQLTAIRPLTVHSVGHYECRFITYKRCLQHQLCALLHFSRILCYKQSQNCMYFTFSVLHSFTSGESPVLVSPSHHRLLDYQTSCQGLLDFFIFLILFSHFLCISFLSSCLF